MDDLKKNWRQIVGAVAVLLAVISGTVVLCDEDNSTPKPPILDGVKLDQDNNVDKGELDDLKAAPTDVANVGPDYHEDSRDETPPGVTRDEADEALITPPNPLPKDEEYKPQPVGGAQNFRCPENFVRNGSPRISGVRVSMQVLHITVSSPGSLRAIWNLFNNPASGASSTFLVELDGECEQILPFGLKPWTQMAFNSASESYEIVTNLMTRNEWLSSPIIRDATLAQLVVSRLKARGLPPRLVDPDGCTPEAGYTDHDRLECGNNHVDVGDGFPWDKFGEQVRQIYKHGTLCGERCQALRRQRNVIAGRQRRHEPTHETYKARNCRAHPHETRPSEYTRTVCRDLKLEIKRQHDGIRRAKATLRSL